ncbi:four-domain proteases inhibitor-like [Ylistrum balloti]|uniref:four-domain proteases inhibitor-like n=1 Tax=Ylistrum balloti TaxID=509963 RepID=UPI002905DAD0|nr:four-domain proteases inhibitor-like [Ylistrum balloti]
MADGLLYGQDWKKQPKPATSCCVATASWLVTLTIIVTTMFVLALTFLVLSVTLASGATHHGHGHGYHTASPGDLQGELDHMTSHFGDHLCIDLLMLDCRNHAAQSDEQICGSDGRTYPNHCYFVHSTCMFENLTIQSHGQCVVTSEKPSTAMPGTGTTMMPIAASTMPSTTPKTNSQVIQSVFCQSKDAIHCDLNISFVCGSDGQLYPNQCELSKAACDDPSLIKVDISLCP